MDKRQPSVPRLFKLTRSVVKNRSLGRLDGEQRREKRPNQVAQKPGQPAQQEAEIVAGGGDHGVADSVASLERIAAHAVFGIGVADDRRDAARRFISRGSGG